MPGFQHASDDLVDLACPISDMINGSPIKYSIVRHVSYNGADMGIHVVNHWKFVLNKSLIRYNENTVLWRKRQEIGNIDETDQKMN